MVNSEKENKTRAITCSIEDKKAFDAICFVFKMKQKEMVSQLLDEFMQEIPEKERLLIEALKNNM